MPARHDPARPRRVHGYCRVSGAEQGRSGTSLDAQREALARYCAAAGLPAPDLHVEVESGSAAKLERRVELHALIAAAAAGDLVIVTKVDRWSRDIVFAVKSVRDLVARGVRWVSIGEGIDASTPQGDSTLGIMAWVADQERQRIRERTVGRRRELRDLGCYVEGLPPVGYRRGRDRRLEVVEADAALVLDVFRRCVAGASIGDIAEHLQVEHPDRHGWDHKTIHKMLRSRVYLGETTTSAGVWTPAHEPIVPRDLWERAQAALSSRRLGGRKASSEARTAGWLLRGLATCAVCGARMGAAYGGAGYYACAARLRGDGCDARYVRVPEADEAVAALAEGRLAELRRELARGPSPAPAPAPVDTAAKKDALLKRRERTLDLAADGAITRDELRERLARIEAEIGRLEVHAAAADRAARAREPAARREVLAELTAIRSAWARATVAERRDVVRRLARRIALEAGAPPRIEWLPVEDLTAPV